MKDSITIQIVPNGLIFTPNAFSPNDDGINDTYKIGGKGIESFEGTIHIRWGGRILKFFF